MTIKAFKAKIQDLGGTVVSDAPYNTNNAWGFGGMLGRRVTATLGGLALLFDYGQLCYRHMTPEHEDHVHVADIYKPFTAEYFFKLWTRGARTAEDLLKSVNHERIT